MIAPALDTQRGGPDDNSAQANHLVANTLKRPTGGQHIEETYVAEALTTGTRMDLETEDFVTVDPQSCDRLQGYGDAQETRSREVLRALREAHGAEAVLQWKARIAAALRSSSVLRQGLHEGGFSRETQEARLGGWLDGRAHEGEGEDAAGALRALWFCAERGSSQGRKLAKQLAGELGTPLSELPHEGTRFRAPAATHAPTGVRRLTPTEAERLQGFPDGWTQLPEQIDGSANPKPDSHRYSQMGNAVTVNVARWIGERIVAESLGHEVSA